MPISGLHRRLQLSERRRQPEPHRLARLRRPRLRRRRSRQRLQQRPAAAVQHRRVRGAGSSAASASSRATTTSRRASSARWISRSRGTSGSAVAASSSCAWTCSTRSTRPAITARNTTMTLTSPSDPMTITEPAVQRGRHRDRLAIASARRGLRRGDRLPESANGPGADPLLVLSRLSAISCQRSVAGFRDARFRPLPPLVAGSDIREPAPQLSSSRRLVVLIAPSDAVQAPAGPCKPLQAPASNEVRMKRRLFLACLVVAAASAMNSVSARQMAFRTLNDRFAPPRLTTLDAWKTRADYLREHVLASAGLLPMPDEDAASPAVFGEVHARDYSRRQGVLREPARLLRHRQSLPADRRRSVSRRAVAARPLDLRPAREHVADLRARRARSASRARDSSSSPTT